MDVVRGLVACRAVDCEATTKAAALQSLAALRSAMAANKIDAVVVPSDDPHLSEIPPDCFARRAFISNFTGSAGTAVVTANDALLWTDGRYFLQAERQLPEGWQLMKAGLPDTPTVSAWLSKLEAGKVVGIDPTVHSAHLAKDLKEKLGGGGVEFKTLESNLVDKVWGSSRPSAPLAPARLHPEKFAGATAKEKLSKVRAEMAKKGADALVVSALDEVSWLFNLRGSDVHRAPVVMGYALVEATAATLFVDKSKVPDEVSLALEEAGVSVRGYNDVWSAADALAKEGKKVWSDPKRTNFALHLAVGKGSPPVEEPSPLALMKAKKSPEELNGMREAHRRDGAALVAGLARLEASVLEGKIITEVDVDREVTSRRASVPGFLDLSFDTIAGYGENGAIIHYRAEKATAATLGTGKLFLLDSGAQYVDGTTDVTRTMHFGTPSQQEKECFTRVLKGHIGLATAIFPEGVPGCVIDAFARRPLWAAGLDYRHGTGHGVGAALCVHEGPQSIGPNLDNKTPLEVGMVVSNEPGFYLDGSFGIRIENLLEVVEKATANRFGGKKYLGFEPLTLVPLQRRLVDVSLLTSEELAYFNAYQGRVRKELAPLLSSPGQEEALEWLFRETTPLAPDNSSGEASALATAAMAAVGG